jgi:hypothetical protein
MSQDDFLHFLYMSKTDASLRRQRHGHRNKWVKGPECSELIILGLVIGVLVVWLISGGK